MEGLDNRLFVAEWFVADLEERVLATTLAGLADAVIGAGQGVRLTMTLSIPADEVVFAVFAAQSSDAVRAACVRALLPPPLRLNPAMTKTYARVTG